MATIAEKSTELSIDIAQIALDAYGVNKYEKGGVFQHFCSPEHGSNIYLKDENGDPLSEHPYRWCDEGLVEATTLADAEAAFKTWLDSQEFYELPAAKTYVKTW